MGLTERTELEGGCPVGSKIPGMGRGKGAIEKSVTVTFRVCWCSAHMMVMDNRLLTNFSFGDYQENLLI